MSYLVCPYCKGHKFNRHDKPAEISEDFWAHQCGPLNLCILCHGHGRLSQDSFNLHAASGLVGVVFLTTRDRKALMSCAAPGCRLWIRASFLEEPMKVSERTWTGKCSAGHSVEVEIVPE